jgi:outer membrane protein assembly factor BamB
LTAGGGYGPQIASTGDIIFVVESVGMMTALRMEDGKVLWTKANTTSGGLGSAARPIADSGILFVVSSSGKLNHTYLDAYRASDGTRLWEHDEGANAPISLGAANGVLYANIGLGVGLDALRGTDGTTLWHSKVSVTAPPIIAGNVIYLNNYGEVYAVNASNGAQLWHYTPPQLASPSDLAVSVGEGLVFASNSLRLNALHASDGTLAWHNDYHGLVQGPSYANGVLYLATSSSLYALNPLDGSPIWSVALSGNGAWPAVLTGGTLYQSRSEEETATPSGYIYALNPASGAVLWKYTQTAIPFTNVIVQ